jgi:hypothetical protein
MAGIICQGMPATSCDAIATQETSVYNVEDDVAGIICQA